MMMVDDVQFYSALSTMYVVCPKTQIHFFFFKRVNIDTSGLMSTWLQLKMTVRSVKTKSPLIEKYWILGRCHLICIYVYFQM